MRLFFVNRTYWKDINGHFEAGQDAHFLPTPEVKKLIEDKNAIQINDKMVLTDINREFIVIQNQQAQAKKKSKSQKRQLLNK